MYQKGRKKKKNDPSVYLCYSGVGLITLPPSLYTLNIQFLLHWLLDKRPVICKAGTVDGKGVFLPGAKKKNEKETIDIYNTQVYLRCCTLYTKQPVISAASDAPFKQNTKTPTLYCQCNQNRCWSCRPYITLKTDNNYKGRVAGEHFRSGVLKNCVRFDICMEMA